MLLNLLLVMTLIGAAGAGGYILARAHFTATITNRVLAYQSRLARAKRDAQEAIAEADRLDADLDRMTQLVQRYEMALFVSYPEDNGEAPVQPPMQERRHPMAPGERGTEQLVRNLA